MLSPTLAKQSNILPVVMLNPKLSSAELPLSIA